MTTEAQAKQKFCPGIPQGQRPKCIGSECMGWVWLQPESRNSEEDYGYCGMTSHGPHPQHH